MSQRKRILSLLRQRGRTGLHSFELVEAGMPRGASAICDLRKEGYDITATRERFRGGVAVGVRYVLHESRASRTPEKASEAGLFDAPTAARNPYQYESEAA